MATCTVSLVGTSYPRAVQVVVGGLTNGQVYEIRGQWAGGDWAVRAGTGTSDGSQLVRSDFLAPINVPITYAVTVDGALAVTSSPITVDYTRDGETTPAPYVLTTLDGSQVAEFKYLTSGDRRELSLRTAAFQIPGRSHPVVMYDIAGGESGELICDTTKVQSPALKAILQAGGPVLLRTNGSVADLDAVTIAQVVAASSQLLVVATGKRRWSLGYLVLDDPQPNTFVPTSTWDDFDAVYTGLAWGADFDSEWTGNTWDQFDIEDWASRA